MPRARVGQPTYGRHQPIPRRRTHVVQRSTPALQAVTRPPLLSTLNVVSGCAARQACFIRRSVVVTHPSRPRAQLRIAGQVHVLRRIGSNLHLIPPFFPHWPLVVVAQSSLAPFTDGSRRPSPSDYPFAYAPLSGYQPFTTVRPTSTWTVTQASTTLPSYHTRIDKPFLCLVLVFIRTLHWPVSHTHSTTSGLPT